MGVVDEFQGGEVEGEVVEVLEVGVGEVELPQVGEITKLQLFQIGECWVINQLQFMVPPQNQLLQLFELMVFLGKLRDACIHQLQSPQRVLAVQDQRLQPRVLNLQNLKRRKPVIPETYQLRIIDPNLLQGMGGEILEEHNGASADIHFDQ